MSSWLADGLLIAINEISSVKSEYFRAEDYPLVPKKALHELLFQREDGQG